MLNILAVLLARILLSSSRFKEIYEAHVGLVQFVLRKFKLPEQEVEDIVQDTFLKLHQMEGPIDAEKLKGLLTTIARNKAVDVLRRRKRQRTDLAGETVDEGSSELWKNDPRRILEAQVVEEFLDEIKDQPGAEVLIMFYRDGLTVREIAAQREEPLGNVTSRLSRARARFKEHLQFRLDSLSTGEEWS